MNLCIPNRPREECGVFGIYNHPEAAKLTYFGLYALQHRGQESAGIVTSDGSKVREHKAMGLVPDVFNEAILSNLPGHMAVGHVRYSTTGSSLLKNAQPFTVCHKGKTLALAHNGNLINARSIRSKLENEGSIFQSTMDSEVVLHLIAKSAHKGLEEAVIDAFSLLKGAYSIVLLTEDKLIAIRDPRGFRPLCLGKLNDSYVLASETCALDLIEAQYIRDVEPGEIIIIDQNGLRSIKPFPEVRPSFCIFELIYFARPDSNIFGTNVYMTRKRMGELLAREAQVQGDFVMPFPDSGNYAAVGAAQASGIPFEIGVIRNHYVGRTFIQPSQTMRDFGVKVKLNPVRCLLKNKRVIIVEDSIIRGTTSRTRVHTIRGAGAREVHMLVSCPPHRFPCYYGIDFSNLGELIASRFSVEEIRRYLGLDSLHYLSLEGLLKSVNGEQNRFCLACFDGNYPLPLEEEFSKFCLEKGKS
ncbi:MAG: amidophosphoribosyltransferase [Thermodesulfobacteriota bacterium]|nr:amidophosphoribosyltransferase [Thermodesulfobacteriota bacterium]